MVTACRQPGNTALITFHIQQADDITGCFFGGVMTAIAGRKARAVTHKHRSGALFIGQPCQRRLDCRFPPAHHKLQTFIELCLIDFLRSIGQIQRVAQQRNAAVFQPDCPAEHRSAGLLDEHSLDLTPHARGHVVARQPDENIKMPPQRRAERYQLGPWPVGQRHGGQRHALKFRQFQRYQQIMR